MKVLLQNIYNLGITHDFDSEDRRRATLINQIIFFCGLTPIIMLPLVAVLGGIINVLFIIGSSLVLSTALLFSKSGNHRYAMFYFTAIVTLVIAGGALLFQNTYTDMFLIPGATIPFLTLKSKREAMLIFVINMIVFCFIIWGYKVVEPLTSFEGVQQEAAYISGVIIVASLILIAIYRLREQNDRFESEIIKQKEEIEQAHKEITDSINYAERIQRSFLATKELLAENLDEYFVFFKPKDVVSGDFYWADKLSNGNFAIVNADSTGHGVPGAIMSILNISSMERAVEHGAITPAAIFNQARTFIIERLKKDGSEQGGKDGMDASIVCFNADKTKLSYTAAQNPIWIIRAGEVIQIKAEKMPVGKHDNDHLPFEGGEFDLQKGDQVYTLTDGFQDQFGGPKGKKFMVKKMREYVLSVSHLPMQEQCKKIDEVFSSWKGDLEQVDDVCVIGVRV